VKGTSNPHRFRHFFASLSAADDMAEDELKEKLGQTSGKMASHYVHLHAVRRKKRESIIDRTVKK